MRKSYALLICSLAVLAPASGVWAKDDERAVPYWASVATDHARMRKGPAETLPVIWEYRRENLPVKVVALYENWRKVRDPDGTEGWMAARLLSAKTTAIVVRGIAPLHDKPDRTSSVRYRAEAGVVGKLKDCTPGWCLFDVGGRKGWVETARIWGGHD